MKITRKEFVNKLIKKYNLEDTDKNFNKINSKINRILNKNNELNNKYNKLEIEVVGKSTNKLFDKIFQEDLETELRDYLTKINGLSNEDIEASKSLLNLKNSNNDNDKALFELLINQNINQPKYNNLAKIERTEKLAIFIEALFYAQFEFDETAYVTDLAKFKNFKNDKNVEITEEITQIIAKLKEPVKFYVKPKY